MKLLKVTSVVTVVTGAIVSSQALAQAPSRPSYRPPSSRPAVSPYQDLTRGDPSFQYQRRIRPERELRGAVQQQGQSIQQLQQSTTPGEQQSIGASQQPRTGLSATGHPTQFLNLSHYYSFSKPGGR